MTDFFISDPHFGNTNIIDYEKRPFKNADEMDAEMIRRWNKVVKSKHDRVVCLGDFSLTNAAKTKEIFDSLCGRKWIVLGNHDRDKSVTWWRRLGFERVYDFPIIYKEFFILSHEPIYLNLGMPYANVHGHINGKSIEGAHYLNVSVERINYTPITFEEVKRRLGAG